MSGAGAGPRIHPARVIQREFLDQQLHLFALEQLQAAQLGQIGDHQVSEAAPDRAEILVLPDVREGKDGDGILSGWLRRERRFLGDRRACGLAQFLAGQERKPVGDFPPLHVSASQGSRRGIRCPGGIEVPQLFMSQPEVDPGRVVSAVESERTLQHVAGALEPLGVVVRDPEMGDQRDVPRTLLIRRFQGRQVGRAWSGGGRRTSAPDEA